HIDSPLRLEFLTAILLVKQFPDASVKPNYKVDDFGTPTSCAPAGKPDILCDELGKKYIVEVTTIRSSAQIASEMVPITHHLKDLKNQDSAINCSIIFIAPIIHERSITYADFIKFEQSIRIENISIEKLIFNFESNIKKLDLMTS
ncbi:AlwI family type II restriction endonuclease, partial [Pseudomonadota bacterium]|nr:AlwI family type II restriction endonuclease [Pseudomonadota bacterium]